MSVKSGNRGFGRLATLAVASVGLAAVALPLSPAKAQAYFGVDLGGVGFGVGAPGYYYPPSYYPHPYGYYSYPYYASPYYAPYYYPYGYGW